MDKKRLTVGIVGGLCPLATADIYLKAMKKVKVEGGDADYPDIIINAALEQTQRGNHFDNSPERNYDMQHRILYIYQVCRELKQRGVDKILVPDFLSCNFAGTISEQIRLPLIDIVGVLARRIRAQWPEAVRVGVLATSAAIENKIFEKKFGNFGLTPIYPDADIQARMVMEAIYGREGVKYGVISEKPGELIRQACQNLYEHGAEVVVSAITELPLIERQYYPDSHYLDCNEAIAEELVHDVVGSERSYARCGTIGILGGLGPAATVDIFDKIVRHTPASCDQEHIKVVIENNPQIPDRTAALRNGAEDPSIAMLATAEKLVAAGVDFIIVPCNTAHVFIKAVEQHITIPVLSMIESTAQYIQESFPNVRKIGLLATTGTVESAVYAEPLMKRNFELLTPDAETQQNAVMEAIYGKNGIKAGHKTGVPRDLLLSAAADLVKQGAQLIILGCTEIPLALRNGDLEVPFVDPTDILAKAAVQKALGIQH
ncbi:MAG: amino acid racemase [Victivallaceae bacterium]|nr:amino acid racemase [Victivallaceae bacterium]